MQGGKTSSCWGGSSAACTTSSGRATRTEAHGGCLPALDRDTAEPVASRAHRQMIAPRMLSGGFSFNLYKPTPQKLIMSRLARDDRPSREVGMRRQDQRVGRAAGNDTKAVMLYQFANHFLISDHPPVGEDPQVLDALLLRGLSENFLAQ